MSPASEYEMQLSTTSGLTLLHDARRIPSLIVTKNSHPDFPQFRAHTGMSDRARLCFYLWGKKHIQYKLTCRTMTNVCITHGSQNIVLPFRRIPRWFRRAIQVQAKRSVRLGLSAVPQFGRVELGKCLCELFIRDITLVSYFTAGPQIGVWTCQSRTLRTSKNNQGYV
jgi:hypothetical protein